MPFRHVMLKVCSIILIVGGAILTYFYFLDGTVINPVADGLKNRVYQTTEKSYTVGDNVIVYSSQFCKFRGVLTSVYWFLEDDVQIAYPKKESNFQKACFDHTKIEIGVLPGFIGGTNYHFVGRVVYHLPARDVIVNVKTNDFYVKTK